MTDKSEICGETRRARALRRLGGVLAVVAALGAGGALAETVVLSSTAPGVATGAVLDEANQITIPAGASVTLIDASGATRTVRGPYSGPVGAAPGS